MPVTNFEQDRDALTMTVTAEFAAAPERVWTLWEDPRQLERWWGGPEWPATFTRFDFRVGGGANYELHGPDDQVSRGWWRIREIDPAVRLVLEDGWADADGSPADMPTTVATITFESIGGGTRMVNVTAIPTPDYFEQLAGMGVEAGARASLGQIDAILEEQATE